MDKIRVLHVIKALTLGGAERNLLNLVQNFGPGVENHVAYCYGGEFEPAFQRAGITLFKYSLVSHKIKSFRTLPTVSRLLYYLLSRKIHLVHTHNFNAHVWGLAAAKLAGAKIIEHVHDFRYIPRADRERGGLFVTQFEMAGKIKNLSDRVIVLTGQNKDFLVAHQWYPEAKIRLVRNGIPLDEQIPATSDLRRQWNIPEDSRVVLTPARMSAEKNIDLIFKIAPEVIRRFPRVFFLIAGDGPLLDDYKKRAAAEKLGSHMRFIGFYPEMKNLLQISDLFLLPSFLELHSIALLEALSMKVPVITSKNVGCNSEIFTDRRDAVLLDPFRSEGWGEAIVKFLNEPSLSSELAGNAFELCCKNFDIRDTAKKIEEIYGELAG